MLPPKRPKLQKAIDTSLSPQWRHAWRKFYEAQEAFQKKLSRKFFPNGKNQWKRKLKANDTYYSVKVDIIKGPSSYQPTEKVLINQPKRSYE